MQTKPNYCPRRCDRSHPGECIFRPPQAERLGFAIVRIVGAAMAAVALTTLLVMLL